MRSFETVSLRSRARPCIQDTWILAKFHRLTAVETRPSGVFLISNCRTHSSVRPVSTGGVTDALNEFRRWSTPSVWEFQCCRGMEVTCVRAQVCSRPAWLLRLLTESSDGRDLIARRTVCKSRQRLAVQLRGSQLPYREMPVLIAVERWLIATSTPAQESITSPPAHPVPQCLRQKSQFTSVRCFGSVLN